MNINRGQSSDVASAPVKLRLSLVYRRTSCILTESCAFIERCFFMGSYPLQQSFTPTEPWRKLRPHWDFCASPPSVTVAERPERHRHHRFVLWKWFWSWPSLSLPFWFRVLSFIPCRKGIWHQVHDRRCMLSKWFCKIYLFLVSIRIGLVSSLTHSAKGRWKASLAGKPLKYPQLTFLSLVFWFCSCHPPYLTSNVA